jgi:hypothetical protein
MTGITTEIGPRAGPISETEPLTTEGSGSAVFSISVMVAVEVLVEVTSRSWVVECGSIPIPLKMGESPTDYSWRLASAQFAIRTKGNDEVWHGACNRR